MTRRYPRIVALLVAVACWLTTAATAAAQAPSTGILLLAHGGAKNWNQSVADAAADVNRDRPVEVAFGMATRANIQAAIDRLIARGVTEIVAVPLFVSPHSSVVRSTEYLLGLRKDAPADLAIFAKMNHGSGDAHAGHAGHTAAAPEDGTKPVVSRVPIRMAGALGRHPLVAAILADRAVSISQDAAHEAVVLVAHGPVPSDDNARWLDDLASLGDAVKASTTFKAVEWQTVRDDAPEPIRNEAATELRNRVTRLAAGGDRVLIVPVVISFGGIEQGVRKRLDGLAYTMPAQGLLPDPRIAQWIRESAGAARAPETARLFDSVTVSATLNPSVDPRDAGHRRGDRRRDHRQAAGRERRRPGEVRARRLRRDGRQPRRPERLQHPRHRRQPGDDPGGRHRDQRAVRLRPLQRPPVRARPRHAEVGGDRAQRRIRPLRQRRARRRRLVLHQGSGRLSRQPRLPHRRQAGLRRTLRRHQRQRRRRRRPRTRPRLAVRQRGPRSRSPQQGHGRDRRRDAHGPQPAGSPLGADARQGRP